MAAGAGIEVVSYKLVSSNRVGRTVFDYTYQVTFHNAGSAVSGVTAAVNSTSSTTSIESALIALGDIPAGATVTPAGSIVIRQDRTYAFSPQSLVWSFTNSVVTPQERTASLAAIHAQIAALADTDITTANQQLAQFISSRPEFIEAGTSDNGLTVWGTWSDGTLFVFPRGREPGATTAARATTGALSSGGTSAQELPTHAVNSASSAEFVAAAGSSTQDFPSNLPASNQVRVLNAMGPGWANPVPKIESYLRNAKYVEPQSDATVSGLKAVGGDGVFYLSTHGGTAKGKHQYALWTTTKRSETFDEIYSDDIKGLRLVIVTACQDATVLTALKNCLPSNIEDHYGITAQFINAYWGNFADHSLVYIDGCSSLTLDSSVVRAVLLAKKASLILGWSEDVGDVTANDSALYLFDKLTGANDPALKNNPKSRTGFNQRAFDWKSALADCKKNANLCTDGTITRMDGTTEVIELQYQESQPGCVGAACTHEFGILVPSIGPMYVANLSAPGSPAVTYLFITGEFGVDPGDSNREVVIGTTKANVAVWSPSDIIVTIPETVAGNVVVRVREQVSNFAQLTEWKLPLTLSLDDFQSLSQQVTVTVHFRADIRKTVRTIGQPPVEPSGGLPDVGFPVPLPQGATVNTLLEDSQGQYSCSGSATVVLQQSTQTEKWLGSGGISFSDLSHLADNDSVDVKDSQTLVVTLKAWQKFCTAIINGKSGRVSIVNPGEAFPGSIVYDATLALFLDTTGAIYPNSVSNPAANSRGALLPGTQAKVTLKVPSTPPSSGAVDPNSPR
jgi:hypothetical protein